ncbi:MAG TPA: ATP-binding cassette domain-containing protein, partial [Candidatus Babeliales bacterium]|nr:ATP-binding cassette domain-containing protein [Candidatus Babeliales bacterium]
AELSGGMLKRVGLARTLLTQPELIFYDEPTSGLDPITTTIIHQLMADLQQKLQLTAVVVSHDMEIFKYADNVALLAEGRIRWWGPAKTIWQADNPYIYQFLRGLTAGPLKS